MQELDIRIHEEERNRRRVPSVDVVEATTLDDVLAVLRRQFVPLAACAVLGVVLGLVHHVTSPKQYYTAATVLVDERPTQLPEEMNASSPFVRNDTSLLNEIQVLRSLELATAVVEQTDLHNNDLFWSPPSSLARTIISTGTDTLKSLAGLGEDAAPSATTDTDDQESARILAAASKLQRDIGIERIGLSFSIEISYVGHDPALAALLVNTYADAYLADHLSANLEKTQRTAEWMRNRLADLQQRSEAVSREAANLRESDPTQVQTLRELAQQLVHEARADEHPLLGVCLGHQLIGRELGLPLLRKTRPPRAEQGFTVFFTGFSGSGKSTVANALMVKLMEMGGRPVTLLDGDIVRKNLSSELGFSKEHRDLNIRRIGYVASEITKNGGIAICAPIAPYATTRRAVREDIEQFGAFVEVHVATSIEECERRDRKGLYKLARAGKIKEFTGISDPYDRPENPDLRLETESVPVDNCAHQVILKLESLGLIKA